MSTWVTKSIGELGRIITGQTPSTKEAELWGGDIPFVSPKDMSWDAFYLGDTKDTASKRMAEKYKGLVVPKHAVMYTALSYGFGKMAISKQTAIANRQIHSICVNSDHCYRFVFYLLKHSTPYIFAFNSGIDTPIVPKSVFSKIELKVPPLEEQRRISAILSAYDDLIENNKRRIALLEKMAEEIYREWFVRFRFPGYQTAEFEKGIPKGWGMAKLEKAFQFLGGGTPSKENEAYWKDGNINWFTPSDITGASGIFLSGSGDHPNEEGLNNCSAKLFPAYSIMMTSRATIGEIGINRTKACTNQGFITCIPNERYPLYYLYFWLKLSRNYFISLCGGATFPEINKSTFKRIEILTPSESVVKEFSCVVTPIFDQVEILLQENENLDKTKNLLVPRLISGKLSVENLDIHFPLSMQELG